LIEEASVVTASRSSRLAGVLFAGVAAFAAVAACSAGQITQTATQVGAVPGANVNAGPNGEIGLRDLLVLYNDSAGYPAGGTAPLVVRIFNDGQTTIRLIGVTAGNAAAGVALVGGQPTATPTPTAPPSPAAPASPTAAAGTSPTPAATPPATATPAATPTPGATPPATGAPPAAPAAPRIEIPAGSYVLLVPGQGPYLQLVGLTGALTPGMSVPVTFTFEGIAPVTVTVPFGLPASAGPRSTPEVAEHE
jgi:copper(I)-binding protein